MKVGEKYQNKKDPYLKLELKRYIGNDTWFVLVTEIIHKKEINFYNFLPGDVIFENWIKIN